MGFDKNLHPVIGFNKILTIYLRLSEESVSWYSKKGSADER